MILVEILTTDALITHLSCQHSRLDDVIWQPPEVQGVSINILSLVVRCCKVFRNEVAIQVGFRCLIMCPWYGIGISQSRYAFQAMLAY